MYSSPRLSSWASSRVLKVSWEDDSHDSDDYVRDDDEDQYHVNWLKCDHNGEFDDKVQYVNRVGRKVDGEAGHDVDVEGELEKLRERIEEENSAKADIQRSLSRWGYYYHMHVDNAHNGVDCVIRKRRYSPFIFQERCWSPDLEVEVQYWGRG